MPIRTVKRGSGITEEELEKFEFTGDPSDPISDREFAQFVSFMDQQRIQRARQKDWLAHASHQILAVQGLPAYFGYYRGSERGWLRWEKSDDYELEIMRILGNPHVNLRQRLPFKVRPEPDYRALEDIAEEIFGSDSDEHFAARIVGLFYRLMIARREKFQSELEHIIFTLGECCAAWKLKHDAEDVWKTGKRVRSGGQKGAKIAHGSSEIRNQLQVQIRHKVDGYIAQGLKKTEAYNRVADELKLGFSTVRLYCSSKRG